MHVDRGTSALPRSALDARTKLELGAQFFSLLIFNVQKWHPSMKIDVAMLRGIPVKETR